MEQAWERFDLYFLGRRRIFESGKTALLVGDGIIHVARRGHDRSWRFAISLFGLDAVDTEQGIERGRISAD